MARKTKSLGNKLRITTNNRKMKALSVILLSRVGVVDLPAGKSCPAAHICKAWSERDEDGNVTIHDGPECVFRCYAASAEIYPSTRDLRYNNFRILQGLLSKEEIMNELYDMVMVGGCKYNRYHSSGEFFKEDYFVAAMELAEMFPERIFYGYTKMVNLYAKYMHQFPDNFRFNVSEGGKFDHLITPEMPITRVIIHKEEAHGLPIYTGVLTELAVLNRESFCIPVHGTQPAGSMAGIMVRQWKKMLANED